MKSCHHIVNVYSKFTENHSKCVSDKSNSGVSAIVTLSNTYIYYIVIYVVIVFVGTPCALRVETCIIKIIVIMMEQKNKNQSVHGDNKIMGDRKQASE